MKPCYFALSLCGLLLVGLTGFSQAKKDTLSIEQALSRYSMRNIAFSPDGSKAVVVVSQSGIDETLPASHIWLVDVPTKTIRQYTSSAKSETSPKWSPDGKTLAFLSARNGRSQIFLMDVSGGEALQLTKSKTGVNNFDWNPKGQNIAYLADEPATAAEEKRKTDKYDERASSEEDKPTRLFTIDVNTKATKQLGKQNWDINEVKWTPAGDGLLMVTHMLPGKELPEPKLVLYTLKDSTITNIPGPAHSFWGNVVISPDGSTIAYSSARTDGPTTHDIFIQSLKSGAGTNITAKSIDLPVLNARFINDHHLLSVIQKGFTTRLFDISDKGDAKDYGIDQNVRAFDVSANGTVIFESGTASKLSELWLAGPDKKAVQLSHFNIVFDKLPLVQPRFITYKSFDGKSIEGSLFKPTGADATKPLPLVLYIHGGPTGSFTDDYSAWVQLFVQKGYAVFCPNIRGSLGYGWDFITSNRKDWGGNDFKDVMAGVDYLIKNEHIDPNRLGISGWSYGGYMAEWAITQTTRFKAAMSGAGMANLATEFGTESNASYDHWFWGTPYEHYDDFFKHSPIAFIKNAKTPTLIIQGENDTTDPLGQSQELYRGLRYYNVPTELVVYPREPHGFREMKHTMDYYRRMLAWFDKYMK
jgi:dipeptidyl aminopeptidase/acylaminoacyl peptidase